AHGGGGGGVARAGQPSEPAPEPAPRTVPHARGALAHTGTDHTLQAVAASAALVAGGVVLRRRFRPGSDG
ncbi:LPXTG cell wall anchor domain-containing protein, partial [Streptomyces sp. WAC04114]|uniref:LPXTG cell wall anchor domain-containing protein n=1 Tax=Streptomyces sp. WAC04114 TaxID=2867961 RepID=UPI0021AB261D